MTFSPQHHLSSTVKLPRFHQWLTKGVHGCIRIWTGRALGKMSFPWEAGRRHCLKASAGKATQSSAPAWISHMCSVVYPKYLNLPCLVFFSFCCFLFIFPWLSILPGCRRWVKFSFFWPWCDSWCPNSNIRKSYSCLYWMCCSVTMRPVPTMHVRL